MNFSRRGFLGAVTAAFAGRLVAVGGERPVLKVGIVSDTHVKTDPSTVEPLLKAFLRFAAEGVRVVVISGDLCHEGELRELELLMGAWHRAFPKGLNAAGEKVEPFFVFGNHDYHDASYMKGRQVTDEERRLGIAYNKDAAWKLITGEDRFPGEIMKREIGGIVFIGAHWSHEKEVPAWLEAHAAELPKDRPIVYVQHPHPKGTCFGKWASNDGGVNFEALMKWPNLFAVSGHSHISVSYDDAIWQGGFCSMGAGSTLRTNPRKYEYNADIPVRQVRKGLSRHMPKADCGSGWQSTVMTIYPSRIVLDRREHRYDDHLGENWDIPFPFVHDKAHPYRIAAAAAAPAFMSGARVKIVRSDGLLYPQKTPVRQIRISFPAASSDGPHSRVIDYRVEVLRKSDGTKVIERLVQQEGASLAEVRTLKREGWCAFGLDELPHGTALSVKVTPVNAGGRGGRALVEEFTV